MNQPIFRTAGQKPQSEPDLIDLSAILGALVRRWKVIAVCVCGFGLLGLYLAITTPHQYTAQAVVLIVPGQDALPLDGRASQASSGPDAPLVQSEIEMLRSRTLALRVVDRLGLANKPQRPSTLQQVLSLLPTSKPAASQGQKNTKREAAADAVIAATNISRRESSYAIELNYTDRDPKQAALVANTLTKFYLDWKLESRFEGAREANAWLSERTEALQHEVAIKEAAAESFRAAQGLLSTDGATLTEQQVREAQGTVIAARADIAEKAARVRQAEALVAAGGSPETVGAALNSDVIRALRGREAEAARRESDLLVRYGERHPELQKSRAERLNVQEQIKAEITRIMANLRNEVEVAQTRLDTLNSTLYSLRGDLTSNNASLVKLRELEREASATRVVYEDYLKRFQQISDQALLKTIDARVMSPAAAPHTPSGPKPLMIVILSIAAGVFVAIGIIFVWGLIDDTLSSADEVERRIGLPAIASIPNLRPSALKRLDLLERNPAAYLLRYQLSAFAEAFRVIRSAIRYSSLDRKAKVVAITSALPEEGKTTTALCLARVAAISGERVLLFDCDLRLHDLTNLVDQRAEAGIFEILLHGKSWRSCITADSSGADLILVNAGTFRSQEVFSLKDMGRLIDDVRSHYDLILFDCPPALALADAAALAACADTTILVAATNKSAARSVRKAVQQIEFAGGNVLGVALNATSPAGVNLDSYQDSTYYTRSAKYYSNSNSERVG